MKRASVIAVAVLTLAATATADSLTLTRVSDTFSGSGGEFNLTPLSGPALGAVAGVPGLGTTPFSFQSFCVEYTEHVQVGKTYDYVINTGAVNGGSGGQDPVGGNFDPLGEETAWLYTQFVKGALDYDYDGSARPSDAGQLQKAIWFLEDEIGPLVNPEDSKAAGWVQDAKDAVDAPDGWSGIGNVRILNLYSSIGEVAKQDQLIMIPTPIAVLMGLPLLGVIGIFRTVRRRGR